MKSSLLANNAMKPSKKDAVQCIIQLNGNFAQCSKDEVQASFEVLQEVSTNDGLSENDIDQLVEFVTTKKLASSVYISVLNCLIPETKISKKSLKQILLWFFTEVSNGKISTGVGKKFMQWLTGITYYELGDTDIVDSFYCSFLFLLGRSYLESHVCRLLCLISKPEDAKRWVVHQILNVQRISGPKAHTNSLLSLLKSYCPDVVPERISASTFQYRNSNFDEILKKATFRKVTSGIQRENSPKSDSLQWNTWRIYDGKSKTLTRLIPTAESLRLESKGNHNEKKLLSIMDFKTMESVGVKPLQIEVPAQTLSLLANTLGYHVLAFSDVVTKTRFSHKLYHTLCKVFLLELEPYSEEEKINFLNSVRGLQEYAQQSIPVVTTFLFNYLLVWDGEEYREQILGLLEWIEVREEEDLQKYVFPPLRQIFISSGTHCKCLIIDTMGKLMRNLLVTDKREKNCFRDDFQECDLIRSVEAVSTFVSEMIINGLIWNNETTTRSILMAALDFYEITQAVEQAGDLPLIVIMPPTLVYKCLFSNSRICISRLCSLLNRLQMNSVERLYLLGVFQDFVNEVQQLNVYMLDYYRFLWSNTDFQKNEDSFIFHDNIFREIFWRFKDTYGSAIDNVFGIEYNSAFWNPKSKGIRENIFNELAEDYPSIVRLKQIVEERLLQVE